MIQIVIKKADVNNAFEIAKSLPTFFSQEGLITLGEDLKAHELRGAFIDEELVGFITLRKTDEASIEISWLAVKRDFQSKGVGSTLVKDSLREFSLKGFNVCYVKVLAETVQHDGYNKTRNFYKSLGFNTLEIVDPYPGWSSDNPCQIMAVGLKSGVV